MAQCKIYLFTYKRNHLLPRAIKSLLDQTCTDWVCELHNDCPEDLFPGKYLASLNDTRFTLRQHDTNLGAVRSFNLAFEGCAEQYASILEDDNWWEPQFLAEMISLMNRSPEVSIAWSNMYLWKEKANNEWENTGRTIWPEKDDVIILAGPSLNQPWAPCTQMGQWYTGGSLQINTRYPAIAILG
jgi:glycosyltransferase involved in cell wall biosynthesis